MVHPFTVETKPRLFNVDNVYRHKNQLAMCTCQNMIQWNEFNRHVNYTFTPNTI